VTAQRTAPEWLSRQLHFDGALYGEQADRVLLSVVDPFIRRARAERLLTNWFFIRFGEAGTHIRLRVLAAPEKTELLDAALSLIIDDECAAASAFASRRLVDVRRDQYLPELERYGGEHAMRLSEEIFNCCSEAALDQLRKLNPTDQSARLAKALLSQLVLLHAFAGSREAARIVAGLYSTNCIRSSAATPRTEIREAFESGFEKQETFLSGVVHDVWNRLEIGESLLAELDTLRHRLLDLSGRLYALCEAGKVAYRGYTVTSPQMCVRTIVPSYIHMMNNRLGVSVIEEAFLAHVAARSLS